MIRRYDLHVKLSGFFSKFLSSLKILNIMHEFCFLMLCQSKLGFHQIMMCEVLEGLIEVDAVIKLE